MQEVNPYRDLGEMDPHGGKELLVWFTADQMHAYAAAREADAVAAERELCAKVCADAWEIDGSCTALEFANLIRAGIAGGES
jgi:hypothetical protein